MAFLFLQTTGLQQPPMTDPGRVWAHRALLPKLSMQGSVPLRGAAVSSAAG